METIIKEAVTRKELLQFIKFPDRLYRKNKYYVPPLHSGELNNLSKKSNPAFEFCEAKYWLAYQNNEIVGRIAGIINHKFNDKIGKKTVRFSWLDFVEDIAVLQKLLETVELWSRQWDAEYIHGPLGFSSLDSPGMLVEGFEELPIFVGKYNFPYYPVMMDKLGFKKEVDWVEYNVKVPAIVPEKYLRASAVVMERYNLHCPRIKNKRDLLQYADGVFALLNQAYGHIFAFTELSEKQVEKLKKQFFPMLRPDFVSIVLDSSNRVVGFAISIPSLSKAFQKAKGRLFPFGLISIMRALRKNDTLDTLLIGVDKHYKEKGVTAIIFSEIGKAIMKNGIKYIETSRELEHNRNVQNLWNKFEPRQHKRSRCYIKPLGS